LEKDEKKSNKYFIWFKTQKSDFSGCQTIEVNIYLAIELNDAVIANYSYLVNTVDTMGTGRTFEPFMIEPDDDSYAANLLEQVVAK